MDYSCKTLWACCGYQVWIPMNNDIIAFCKLKNDLLRELFCPYGVKKEI